MSKVNFLCILIPFNDDPISVLFVLQSFFMKKLELDKKHYVFRLGFESYFFKKITLRFFDNEGNKQIIYLDITRDPFIKNSCVILKIIDNNTSKYYIKMIHDYLYKNKIIGSLISINDGRSWKTTCDFLSD